MAPRTASLPLGSGAFELHVVLAEPGEAGGPRFASAPGGGDTRAIQAELSSETGALLGRLVLLLPRADGATSESEEFLSNAALESSWQRLRAQLAATRGLPGFQQLVLPGEGRLAPALLPPLLLCTAAAAMVPLLCPKCLRRLRTCRDDARLASHGLPLYSSTATRLLTCESCGDGETLHFWHAPGPAPADLVQRGVRGEPALRAALAEAIGALRKGEREAAEPSPCLRCTRECPLLSLEAGNDTPPALGWHVSPYAVLAPAGRPFDEIVDLLGGRDDEGASRAFGLVYPAEGSGIDAVETLALKTTLVLQVARALREHNRRTGTPYLDLNPGRIVVTGAATDSLPTRWAFQAVLAASPARSRTLAGTVEVPLPPLEPCPPFAAPAVRDAGLIARRSGELVLGRLTPAGNRFHLEVRLTDRSAIFPAPAPRDWVLMTWEHDLFGAETRAAVGRPDPRRGSRNPMELDIVSEPVAIDRALAARLSKASGLRVPDVHYRVFPALGVPEDLHSLAVLLLRVLLVHDRQGLDILAELVAAALAPVSGNQAVSGEAILARLPAEQRARLDRPSVFFRAADRASSRPNAIPDELWRSLVALALGWVRRAADLAQAKNAGDEYPAAHLERFIVEIEDKLRVLHAILFDRQAVHIEIQGVLAGLLAELES